MYHQCCIICIALATEYMSLSLSDLTLGTVLPIPKLCAVMGVASPSRGQQQSGLSVALLLCCWSLLLVATDSLQSMLGTLHLGCLCVALFMCVLCS